MMGERASIFDSEEEVDLSDFAPKRVPTPTIAREELRTVSEAASFRSREPQPSTATRGSREPRRYRTGRNVQLNIKARAEAIEAFYAIADSQKWVLGEAFERAIEALSREIDRQA